jgi:hypothetical protein
MQGPRNHELLERPRRRLEKGSARRLEWLARRWEVPWSLRLECRLTVLESGQGE